MAKKWDVFISHASEDKNNIVRPLADALRRRGMEVWYDEFTLVPGRSLRKSIDEGLAKSTCGVVILSQHFFEKTWPERELGGLFSKEEGRIIPIWHEVTSKQVKEYSPMLADIVAIHTKDGIEVVAEKLCEALPYAKRIQRENEIRGMLQQNMEFLKEALLEWGQAKSPANYYGFVHSFVQHVNDLLNKRRSLLQSLGEELPDDQLGMIYPYDVTSKSVLEIEPGTTKVIVTEGRFCDACREFGLNRLEAEGRAHLCRDCAFEYQVIWRVRYSRIAPNVIGYVQWKQEGKNFSFR